MYYLKNFSLKIKLSPSQIKHQRLRKILIINKIQTTKSHAKFKPCIDIHNGKVKQIVGSTLKETNQKSEVITNFVSDKPTTWYVELYKKENLKGGHIIMLGPTEENRKVAIEALNAWPGALHIGGGINLNNARMFLDAGASHIIITSYIFDKQGNIDYTRLNSLKKEIGSEKIVLDLSCRFKDGKYWVVSNRWQTFTSLFVSEKSLLFLSDYCNEFLIHGVDVEGKKCGVDLNLIELLSFTCPITVTYAGGVRNIQDLILVDEHGKGLIDVTVGSALDIFGGNLKYSDVLKWHKHELN